jgi:hypothetical protein
MVPWSFVSADAVELDRFDITFLRGVDAAFFFAGVGCLFLVGDCCFEGLFASDLKVRGEVLVRGVGDGRALVGVVLPPRFT